MSQGYALARAQLIRALTAYSGYATANGAADGTTIVDAALIGRNDFITYKTLIPMSGAAAYEDKGAISFDNTTGTITLQGTGFSAQIVAGTLFRILNIPSGVDIDVATINTKIGTNTDPAGTTTLFAWMATLLAAIGPDLTAEVAAIEAKLDLPDNFKADVTALALEATLGTHDTDIKALLAIIAAYIDTEVAAILAAVDTEVAAIEAKLDVQKGATGVFYEQVDAAVNITAVNTGETDVLHLSAASTRYIIRSLRLKCADPGANTVTVRLYELVNDGLVVVHSFAITNANFATYHSLMDMFGLSHLAGDELQVTVRVSAGAAIAVTGQYSHAKTNV